MKEPMEWDEETQSSIDSTNAEQLINPRDFQKERWLGEGLAEFGMHIGSGLAWAGFWLGLAALLVACVLKGQL